MKDRREIPIVWKAIGTRHGLNVYESRTRLALDGPGNYLVHWVSDIGGDVPEFWRPFAVIDDSYAVVLFESTSHGQPKPDADFHKLHLPFDAWDHGMLQLPALASNADAERWASISRNYRQFGHKPTPMLFADYFLAEREKESHFAQASEELQQTALSAFREVAALLGFDGPMDCFAGYSIGNAPIRVARSVGYRTISALCSGQNWQDGTFKINHSGMPDRPFFISTDDFRKAGDGGPEGLVGIPQCQRNTFLCHDYNCTYCLEPAWNEFSNGGGGRKVVDALHMSRQYDFFEAMLQNRLSQKSPYFFSVGIEFNGVSPGITESNRMFLEYAAGKTATVPLVFSTGPAVSDFFRRNYTATPETTCFQPDFFCGQTQLGKPAGFPDTLEIEGPYFKSLFKAPEMLPYYHYDYAREWDYPDWGGESLPRNERGYLTPGTYDRFKATPSILDTREFEVGRTDSAAADGFVITVTVRAQHDQRNLALALWDIPREWRTGSTWWDVSGSARFVPVRAPFTGNLNGILVADVRKGANSFAVTIHTPSRENGRTTVTISDAVEGRVYPRDGQVIAYLWPVKAEGATLVVNLPEGKSADAYIAPEGERQPCSTGENRFKLPAGGWMRLVGLGAEEILDSCGAE